MDWLGPPGARNEPAGSGFVRNISTEISIKYSNIVTGLDWRLWGALMEISEDDG